RQHRYASDAESKWFMYVCWGVFEVIINVLYIVGRVDLRFYRPDILPAKVRSIITAEQSYYPSEDEDEDGVRPQTSPDPAYGGYHEPYSEEGSAFYDDEDDEDDGDWEWDFNTNHKEKRTSEENFESPRRHDDNESEFHF
ncbi:hypothetical protein G210_2522, partial [Candida maltosa Xu316]